MTTRFKIAIASSDGKNVDLHFGKAAGFLIYEFDGEKFSQTEMRKAPAPLTEASAAESAPQAESGGCGSGGCAGCTGGGGCCSRGGAKLASVELLSDCRAVIAAQIGGNVRRQFERSVISCFDVDYPVETVLEKLSAYYKKIDA